MASVKVAVRVRPFNQREYEMNTMGIIQMEGKKTTITNLKVSPSMADGELGRSRLKEFTFDYSYWSCSSTDPQFASQEQVFEDLGKEVVVSAFEGYNACIFAYGQTGSGKTYTMMGTPDSEGLIPRICEALFTKMKTNRNVGTTYRTEVSYLEIYNERVKDLLRKNVSQHNLRVREHPKLGPYVQDLSRHLVMDYSDVQELMMRGNAHRTTAATAMNDVSSRSHAIFTLTFSQANFNHDMPSETNSKVNLVDLAGSERADVTGATGQRLKEGGHINKSLVTLGTVISALADMSCTQTKKQFFIPYRDSVLTWLLKDSLGGNSKTIMIATISPADCNYGETLSTLRYANRAKNIINKPTINEDPNVKLIRDLRNEIARLKSLLSDSIISSPTMIEKLHENEARVKVLTEEWTERWKETHKILKEQRTLGLRKSGLGVVLDSELPHLVGIDDDVLSTGITLYHLKEGTIHIGTESSSNKQDIVLNGLGIENEHCIIELKEGKAKLIPLGKAECYVNTILIDKPTHLSQGCVILLGKTNMFRYNDPAEVERLRKEKERGSSLNLSRLSFLSRSASDLAKSIENLNSPIQEIEHKKGKDWEFLEKKRQHIEHLEKEHSEAEERRKKEQMETEAELERKHKELENIRKENEDVYQKAQLAQKIALEEQAKLKSASENIERQLKEYHEKTKDDAQKIQEQEIQLSELKQKKKLIETEIKALIETNKDSIPACQLTLQAKEEIQKLETIQEELNDIQNQEIWRNQKDNSTDLIKNQEEMSNIFNKLKQETVKQREFCREEVQIQKDMIAEHNNVSEVTENQNLFLVENGQTPSTNEEIILLQKEKDIEDTFKKKLDILGNVEQQYFNSTFDICDFNNKDLINSDNTNCYITENTAKENRTLSSDMYFRNGEITNNFNEVSIPAEQNAFEKETIKKNIEDIVKSENSVHLNDIHEEWNDKILTMQSMEEQFQRLQHDLEKRLKSFEEERLQELDQIEIERFHLQELEQQKRINCLVEQEVQRRLFEEKMRLERQYLEQGQRRDLMNFQKHFESRFPDESVSSNLSYITNFPVKDGIIELYDKQINISIPSYTMRGSGSSSHFEYEVKIYVTNDNWTIYRRYKRFRELHHYMRLKYGDKVTLPYFPPRKIFGSKSERVVEERRKHLQIYLNKLMETCMKIECCPLFHSDGELVCKQDIYDFAPFFHKGCFETSKHGTG